MYYSKVEICGVNTARLPTLTDQEKRTLLLAAREGNTEARRKLIAGNLRLVLSIIQRYTGRNENADDLFQVGCIGLIKAVDHFNTDLDVKFSTYAVPMIAGEVKRYLRDNNQIRVSRSVRDMAYRALTAREELSRRLNREPSTAEIARHMNEQDYPCREEDIVQALEAIAEPVSLFDPVYGDGGGADSVFVMDQIGDTGNTEENWLEDIALRDAMRHLSDRERKIITMRFYRGKTQTEIAEEIGISQAQVSRLEKGALAHIRKHF